MWDCFAVKKDCRQVRLGLNDGPFAVKKDSRQVGLLSSQDGLPSGQIERHEHLCPADRPT
jgi:hypothetical protein